MVRGPQAERLTQAVTGGEPGTVNQAAFEWEKCSGVLSDVGDYLRNAADTVKWAIGGETGPAVDAAFQKSADAMEAKAKVLLKGHHALQHAGHAIQTAIDHEAKLEDISAPTAYRAPWGNATDDELTSEATSKAKEKAFADAFAAQEEKARAHADALEEALGKSSSTMKEIHGEPDPPPPPPPPADLSTPTGGPPRGLGHLTSSTIGTHSSDPGDSHFVPTEPKDPHLDPQIDYVPNNTGGGDHDVPSVDGGSTLPGTPIGGADIAGTGSGGSSGPGLGVLGATGGGAAAGLIGAKLSGAIRSGLFPGSGGAAGAAGRGGTAASAVRGIGTSARTGGAGTLGRSGAAAGSSTAGKPGSSGSGARSGAGPTGRSGAGGRGGSGARSGAGPTGRSGRGKDDEKGKKHELFDVEEDWVDDEGAAPGVLD